MLERIDVIIFENQFHHISTVFIVSFLQVISNMPAYTKFELLFRKRNKKVFSKNVSVNIRIETVI